MVKKLLLVLGLGAIALGGVGYHFWRQATYIPAWVEAEPNLPVNTTADILRVIRQQVQRSADPVQVELDSQQLGQILTSEAQRKFPPEQPLPSIRTRIESNSLEVGAVVNEQMLASEQLSPGQKKIIARVLPLLPPDRKSVYVGIVGTPEVRDGEMRLSDNAQIKIGNLSFSVQELAQRLQVSPTKVEQLMRLDLGSINIEDLQLENDQLVLQVGSRSTP